MFFAFAAAGLTAASTGASLKAKMLGDDAAKVRARIIQMENARARRDVIRDFRNQRAQAIMQGVWSGESLSGTKTQGQVSSLGAQTIGAINYLDKANALNSQAISLERQSDSMKTASAILGAGAGIMNQAAKDLGQYRQVARLFGLNKPTPAVPFQLDPAISRFGNDVANLPLGLGPR